MGRKDLGYSGFFDNAGFLGWYTASGGVNRCLSVNTSDQFVVLQDLLPDADSTYDIGSASVRWANLYGDAADITTLTAPTISGNTNVTGDLLPTTDSTHDLGAAATRWAEIYGDTIRAAAFTIDGTNSLETFVDAAAMTPVPTGASGTITTETSSGRWCRVGPLVFITLQVAITDVGTATGDLTITLPAAVPAAADISLNQALACHTESADYGTGVVQLSAYIVTNTKTIQVGEMKDDAASTVLDVENATFVITGCYLAE